MGDMLLVTVLLVIGWDISSITGAEPPGGYYTTRYDHIDIENILNHKRLVQYYAACLLDKGPCTPQGTEFKNILPEAIKTNCLRCTEKQRVVTTRSIGRLKKEYPDIWAQLEKTWDPTGENVKRLLASVNRPRPATEIPLLFDRFGEEDRPNEDQNKILANTEKTSSSTQPTTAGTSSTTTPSSSLPTLSSIWTTKQTTTKPSATTTIFRTTTRPVTSRPFNSIGPNLVVLNPKALIDKVIFTADMVFKTVTGVLEG